MKATIFTLIRSAAAVIAGVLAVLVVLFGAIWLLAPGWLQEQGFPTSASGFALLVGIEAVSGLVGAFLAALLAPRAPRAHGWTVGAILLGLNILTVTDSETPWTLVPAVLLVGLVPLQTWGGISLALRLRGRHDVTRRAPVSTTRYETVE